MVEIENIRVNGNLASCDFLPNGSEEEKGHIVVDIEKMVIVERDQEPSMHSAHAKNLLLDVIKSGEWSGRYTRVWY